MLARYNPPIRSIPVLLALLLAGLLLTACSGGGGGGGSGSGTGSSGPAYDPAASQALVDDGVQQLQDFLAAPAPPPFAVLADVSGKFDQAVQLDPNNPAAAFFGALGQVFLFLDSPEGKAFLAKLGWANFRDHDVEFEDFVSTLFGSIGSVTGTGPFTLPVDEDLEEGDGPVTVGLNGNLTFAELIDFLTVTVPGRLQTAADLLGSIPPNWSITLTANTQAPAFRTLAAGGGTVEIDYTDAMALRAVFSALEAVFTAPGIWNYTGLDPFYTEHGSETGATFAASLQAYFATGQPLSKNAAGVERVLSSLTAFADSFDKAVQALRGELDDQSDDLLAVNGGLIGGQGRYDEEAEVINYGLDAFARTARDITTALTTGGPVGVYQPVAFMSSFDVCDPLTGEITDTEPMNDNTEAMLAPGTIGNLQTIPMSGTPASGSLPVSGSPESDGAYYFAFTLNAAANVSIYSEDTETRGGGGYFNGTTMVPWDVDEDSGGSGNFGLSIPTAYMNESVMPGIGNGPFTFYVRVTSANGDPFTVKVQTDDGGPWPSTAPIFLKGGGGRTFYASTYKVGEISNVNLGNLVRLAGELWDLSDRSSLLVDTSETAPFPISQLNFERATLRAKILSVLPGTAFGPPMDAEGPINLLSITGGIGPPSYSLETLLQPGTGPAFCAYPKHLMPARLFVGGYSIGVGF